jgi:steroid 5-alpha reductase family enzyme
VIGSAWGLLLVGLVVASAAMGALWWVQVRIGDASHVDVAWAALIACAAILYALVADGDATQRLLAAALAALWGFRLAGYLYVNRVRGKEEDGRYRSLRAKWGSKANRNFFWFFQFQAVFVVFFSLPFALVALDPDDRIAPLAWAGTAVWAVGNTGTIVSDRQLARWRADPANEGKTARAGLWSWSRHPNYFFEWITWCGVALVATTAPHGWSAWLVPAVLLYLLFKVTGIPATEAQALRSRADYAEYRRTTSVFVPLPPRRASRERADEFVGPEQSQTATEPRSGGRHE